MGIFSKVFGGVGDILGDITGANDAAKEARRAADENLAFQQQGLDYLKETQRLPLEYRDKALSGLYSFYDPTDPSGQQAFVDQAMASPFYQSMIDQGRQAVGSTLSATGGLRGGRGPAAFAQQDQNVLQNIVNQNLSGLSGFAQTPINAGQVAQQYGQMGNTAAMGRLGAAQTRQAGIGQGLGLLTGIGSLFI